MIESIHVFTAGTFKSGDVFDNVLFDNRSLIIIFPKDKYSSIVV